METSRPRTGSRNGARTLAAAVAVLAAVLVAAIAMSVSEGAPPPEPALLISKDAVPLRLHLGDSVTFYVTVENPSVPASSVLTPTTVYSVTLTDAITPALRLDEIDILTHRGETPEIEVFSGNMVTTTVGTMEPGDYFVLQFDCTLVGPLHGAKVIENWAYVTGRDDQGNPMLFPYRDGVQIIVEYYYSLLPIVVRQYDHTPP